MKRSLTWDAAPARPDLEVLTFTARRPIIQSDCLCTEQRFYSGRIAGLKPAASRDLKPAETSRKKKDKKWLQQHDTRCEGGRSPSESFQQHLVEIRFHMHTLTLAQNLNLNHFLVIEQYNHSNWNVSTTWVKKLKKNKNKTSNMGSNLMVEYKMCKK